jgi:hypothetical protein
MHVARSMANWDGDDLLSIMWTKERLMSSTPIHPSFHSCKTRMYVPGDNELVVLSIGYPPMQANCGTSLFRSHFN